MEAFTKEFEHLKIQLIDLKAVTDDFNESKVIGHGGFGKVYEGELTHHKGQSLVAIKRLDRKHGQGDPEFWKEVMMLSRYSHPNLISLLGYCDDANEKLLVYEHALNGSLDRHLSSTSLSWTQRIRICLDAAIGLCYLHDETGTQQRVVHRDIKSPNILLDRDWNAKIADMGLSRIGPANQEHTAVITEAVGTLGYIDPMYQEWGILTKESDVYSFGVVLFEVLCGRLCTVKMNGAYRSLVRMWKKSYTDKVLSTIIFKNYLMIPLDSTCLKTFSDIAFQCLNEFREHRPKMSRVVQQLKTALVHQEGIPENYEEILKTAVSPIGFKSREELKKLFSQGVLLDGGKTCFSLSRSGGHRELISIAKCFRYTENKSGFSTYYNSRFPVGCYNTKGRYLNTTIRTQFLSPGIAYTVNLIFKYPYIFEDKVVGKQGFIALRYRLGKEKKISIVHLADKSEEDWLIARLHEFTSPQSVVVLEFEFDNSLESSALEGFEFDDSFENLVLEGFEFQPVEINELKMLLSKGVLVNGGNTWFYLTDNEHHCEMISIKECLIPDATSNYSYHTDMNSRFLVGYALTSKFKSHVKAQFLSPHITYTVNFVIKPVFRSKSKHAMIRMMYKFGRENRTFSLFVADKREDDWWMLELFQFTSQGTTADFEIIFVVSNPAIVVEGIEFQPVEIVDNHVLKEDQVLIPSQGTLGLGNHDQEWYFLNGNGKKCLMLSARAACTTRYPIWQYLPESRFGETMGFKVNTYELHITREISCKVLESETGYATYLVYKLDSCDHRSHKIPVWVWDDEVGLKPSEVDDDDKWYIFLVAPRTPVIANGTIDQNATNPANRPKINGIPQQRSNGGWMEVQVWEFQTPSNTHEMIPLHLKLYGPNSLVGVTIQGIEFRPV
ncbi:uncharacterized protein [Rutidosis leptorrhynchoides]|uniref:uncharacterized protein isoform X2 n=1 Tax=Rutidosis leptorrhynchoides TaxID=125765 RepID=UPI003A9A24E1